MLHGEVEETIDVVLDGLGGQIRDEEGEDIFALLRGDVVDRRLMMAVVAVTLIVHLGLMRLLLELLLLLLLELLLLLLRVVMVMVMMVVVVRARERCDSH